MSRIKLKPSQQSSKEANKKQMQNPCEMKSINGKNLKTKKGRDTQLTNLS